MKVKLVAACLLLLRLSACGAKRVYFECGAKVDVMDVQGLVLSPGFPYNYSSGTHCVWQFFVPVGHQLIMEMFDFDVFESNGSPARSPTMSASTPEEEEETLSSNVGVLLSKINLANNQNVAKENQRPMQNAEVKQVVVQVESNKMEMAKVSNSAKRSNESPSATPPDPPPSQLLSGPQPPGNKAQNSVSPQSSRSSNEPKDKVAGLLLTTPPAIGTEDGMSPETQQPVMDACPHDVLYISDLISFSSRFCGSNRPSSNQLVFGSDVEMVEVIMELITTTHWGRGFALLFRYHNHTQVAATGGQRSLARSGGTVDVLLAVVSGAAFFAMALASVLCMILRPKLCAKGSNSTSSINSEVPEGAPNSSADGSELQLVAANHAEPQLVPEKDNSLSPPHPGSVSGCDVSQNAELQCSDGLTELELGTDEVFVISSGPNTAGPPFSPHTQRERFLRHSDTGPAQPSDWPTPDSSALSTSSRGGHVGSVVSARPRAWSVRTFHDFLPPLPQLHKKWCSWNSTSPFTKLVDSGSPSSPSDGRDDVTTKVLSDGHLQDRGTSCKSESSMSTASYPMSHSAHRQRRLNSTSNLRRARFNAPCFGLFSTSPESSKLQGGSNGSAAASHQLPEPSGAPSGQQQQKLGDTAAGDSSMSYSVRSHPSENDHVSVPVFAISEEDDRQPLVLAEDLARPSMVNGQGYESPKKPFGSTHSAPPLTTEESKLAILKNNKIQLPSLSQATVQCSLMGKDM
ncbi:uncharacterized protein si:dkey-112e17.1 [Pygocentrus nattereri]|uniref:uncharacterized protein si:dkey-112e17.1 n=1 Tax=Pygocentrus nattereri TaxID=42514 RepID=UPI001890D6D0|nr:uncharacterized protein si:dkey-112e17.1 [Pygocentrus nattereri]